MPSDCAGNDETRTQARVQSARTDGSLASLNYIEECPHHPEEMSILESTEEKESCCWS